VLARTAAMGYPAIDAGPLGFLAAPAKLDTELATHDLRLSGVWLALPFPDPQRLSAALPELLSVLDLLDRFDHQALKPVVTLADTGSPARLAEPGRAAVDRPFGLDPAEWASYVNGVERVLEICRERGHEPAFHPHGGTYVEAAWEVDRLLADLDIGLCLDPGHLMIGGAAPLEVLAAWAERINHIHIKDARQAAIAELRERHADMAEHYRCGSEIFCALGRGDANIPEIVQGLIDGGYSGWIVVEQDFVPRSRDDVARASADQEANRQFLRDLGL
jgi:inosose dehydratase